MVEYIYPVSLCVRFSLKNIGDEKLFKVHKFLSFLRIWWLSKEPVSFGMVSMK